MAITINGGTGVITGISVGGLPDNIVDTGTLAANSVDSAQLISGSVDDAHMAAMAASKLTGALPAISGASLTGLPIQMEEDYWSLDMSSATGTTVHTLTANFTPELCWMTYNPNGAHVGMATAWMNDGGGTAGSQNVNNGGGSTSGKYWQGNGFIQCVCTGGAQYIDMTSTGAGTYTITNTHPGGSLSGTGYFSLILFGN